ncbi:hypothetical protein ACJX0J_006406, partial [Zea mays]
MMLLRIKLHFFSREIKHLDAKKQQEIYRNLICEELARQGPSAPAVADMYFISSNLSISLIDYLFRGAYIVTPCSLNLDRGLKNICSIMYMTCFFIQLFVYGAIVYRYIMFSTIVATSVRNTLHALTYHGLVYVDRMEDYKTLVGDDSITCIYLLLPLPFIGLTIHVLYAVAGMQPHLEVGPCPDVGLILLSEPGAPLNKLELVGKNKYCHTNTSIQSSGI